MGDMVVDEVREQGDVGHGSKAESWLEKSR